MPARIFEIQRETQLWRQQQNKCVTSGISLRRRSFLELFYLPVRGKRQPIGPAWLPARFDPNETAFAGYGDISALRPNAQQKFMELEFGEEENGFGSSVEGLAVARDVTCRTAILKLSAAAVESVEFVN